MTEIQKQQIGHMRGMGKSYAFIANELGLSENTVKSYCRRNNVGISTKNENPGAKETCCNCGILHQHKPGAKQKRFCSDKCRMAWWKSHPEAVNRKAIYRFICPICKVEFVSYGNAHRKYCSRACFGVFMRTVR